MKVMMLIRNRVRRYFIEEKKEIREESLMTILRLLGAPHMNSIPIAELNWVNIADWHGVYDWQRDYVIDAFNNLWAMGQRDADNLFGNFEDCFEWATKGHLA